MVKQKGYNGLMISADSDEKSGKSFEESPAYALHHRVNDPEQNTKEYA